MIRSLIWCCCYSVTIATHFGTVNISYRWCHPATTPGTGLLLARSVAGPKVGDYSWHGTTPGPWHRYITEGPCRIINHSQETDSLSSGEGHVGVIIWDASLRHSVVSSWVSRWTLALRFGGRILGSSSSWRRRRERRLRSSTLGDVQLSSVERSALWPDGTLSPPRIELSAC